MRCTKNRLIAGIILFFLFSGCSYYRYGKMEPAELKEIKVTELTRRDIIAKFGQPTREFVYSGFHTLIYETGSGWFFNPLLIRGAIGKGKSSDIVFITHDKYPTRIFIENAGNQIGLLIFPLSSIN